MTVHGVPQSKAVVTGFPELGAAVVTGTPIALPAPPSSSSQVQDDEDDEELQRAIEASLAMTQPGAVTLVPGAAANGPPTLRSSQHDLGTSATGLANATGEYNCFLNVIIQCLWHVDGFKRQISVWQAGVLQRHPVAAALLGLFQSLETAEKDWQPGQARQVVNPTELREALDALPGAAFRLGEMSDAAELLAAIYECLREVPQHASAPPGKQVVEGVFGLRLSEKLHCACGVVSHVVKPHIEYFHIVHATALRTIAACMEPATVGRGGRLLREVEQQHRKRCDVELGGCNQWQVPTKCLEAQPQVFTLQLAWEGDAVSGEDIRDTLAALSESLDPHDVFEEVKSSGGGAGPYQLSCMVCYYGQHYHAFIYKQQVCAWLLFDDANVSTIGSWSEVVRRCHLGRMQPSVLFYTRR